MSDDDPSEERQDKLTKKHVRLTDHIYAGPTENRYGLKSSFYGHHAEGTAKAHGHIMNDEHPGNGDDRED
jgi:hypothetical protein